MKVKQPAQPRKSVSSAVPDFASNGGGFPSRVGKKSSGKSGKYKGC